MKRFPLYAKILLWFSLNLVLVAIAFTVVLRGQFRFGWDWLLSGSANDRIEAVTELLVSELNSQPRANWNEVLQRFGNAYHVEFFVFHSDGQQMGGRGIDLPPELRRQMLVRRPFTPPQRGPEDGERGSLPRGEAGSDLGPRDRRNGALLPPANVPAGGFAGEPVLPFADQPRGLLPKQLVRTPNPTRYWVLVRAGLPMPELRRRQPVNVLLMSESLSGGGLFFDPKPWIGAALGALLLSAVLWFPLLRGITRSIAQLKDATRQIAEGRFDVRVNERRRDELGELGQSINQMAGRLEGFVTGQKRFLGDIAHELCSPLAKLRVALGILEQRTDGQQKPYVDSANEKAAQMAHLVNELLSFSRAALGAHQRHLRPVNLREAVDRAVQREAQEGVALKIEVAEEFSVQAEPELLVRAVANLLRNAIRYAAHAGPILVRADASQEMVELTVADEGPGVREEELARLFDPFYRVDSSRDRTTGGVGLGLSIVKTCVESCHGSVTCRNRQPTGLEVTLRLRSVEPEVITTQTSG